MIKLEYFGYLTGQKDRKKKERMHETGSISLRGSQKRFEFHPARLPKQAGKMGEKEVEYLAGEQKDPYEVAGQLREHRSSLK